METDNEKRRRFDALTPIEVNTSEVKALGRGKGFRQRVIKWLESKGAFGKYRNAHKGWDIDFNRGSARDVMAHKSHDGKVALLADVPDLIENGVYLEQTSKGGGSSRIFAAKAVIDGELSTIGIVVHETREGQRYYDHMIQAQRGDRAETGTHAHNTAAENLPEDPNNIHNIIKKHLAVNSKAKKYSTPSGEAGADPFADCAQ